MSRITRPPVATDNEARRPGTPIDRPPPPRGDVPLGLPLPPALFSEPDSGRRAVHSRIDPRNKTPYNVHQFATPATVATNFKCICSGNSLMITTDDAPGGGGTFFEFSVDGGPWIRVRTQTYDRVTDQSFNFGAKGMIIHSPDMVFGEVRVRADNPRNMQIVTWMNNVDICPIG